MKRTTIIADDELLLEVKQLAAHKGQTVTALVQQALREYVRAQRGSPRLGFAGMGSSKEPWTSDDLDRMLAHEGDALVGRVGGNADARDPPAN